jgi:hypothetical protein
MFISVYLLIDLDFKNSQVLDFAAKIVYHRITERSVAIATYYKTGGKICYQWIIFCSKEFQRMTAAGCWTVSEQRRNIFVQAAV